jgi:3-hydroxyisobutyrate dehydrogenase-like beta-hydroxyacid dehydrogenase
MRIGFIGLGNMGSAMAANLIRAGHDVTVYNRSRAKVDALAAEGATPANSVAEACGGDIVMSMLANDDAVAGVTFGDEASWPRSPTARSTCPRRPSACRCRSR